ncbi:LppC family lipoprotein [Psychromonas sp. Urea-02u-13]|nr:LppC family lipoprotein [Psychromonas sp. Urea-02u-13]
MTACTTTATAPEDVPPALFSELEADSAFYLNKDEQLGSDTNLAWQFLAIQALIKERQFVMADAVIDSLQAKVLTPEQSATLGLLIADKFYAQNKLPETQTSLTRLDAQVLSSTDLVHYLKLQVALHIRNELPLEASESLLLLAPRLNVDADKQTYNDLLLAQLTLLPAQTLNSFKVAEKIPAPEPAQNVSEAETISADVPIIVVENKLLIDPDFKAGWYALASLYQSNRLRPNRLTRSLDEWKVAHPEHAALAFMPLVLTDIEAFSPYQPDNIAVLLPLSGRFEKPGKAIQLGLLNAYYHQQKSLSDEDKKMPKLHFFDTQKTSAEQLALQLEAANIDFVIGPLMKKEIDALLPLLKNTPVLALNRFAEKMKTAKSASTASDASDEEKPAETTPVSWHYAFPLSPEDEAKQAAMMINADQHKNPLIIVPNSNYGKRVAKVFRDQWAALTPTSDVQVEAHYFESKAKLGRFIDDVLQTNKSKRRINQMKAITRLSLETEVRSRRDIDAIYIVSKRDELILLKPFIDVSVSPFAQKIPLYASSRSHTFDRNNMQNKELSNLVFSDNPFLLDQQSALSKEVQQAWKRQSFSTLRMFALGFDSYQLIEQLIYLQSSEDAVYKGLVGNLTLDAGNNIDATLSWAKYQDGALFEIASPITAE